MKAILMSIQPKWCAKIANGEKTIEVRKTRPKIELPFKCYIYMTLAKPYCYEFAGGGKMKAKNGKVIGEFVCDEIIIDTAGQFADRFYKEGKFTLDEQRKYGENKPLYGWHISELKIYDKPKELREFRGYCSKKAKCYSDIIRHCNDTHLSWKCNPLTRAPQSWCYVEELED